MVLERERVFARSLFMVLARCALDVRGGKQPRDAGGCNYAESLSRCLSMIVWAVENPSKKGAANFGEGPSSGACALRLHMRVCCGGLSA